MWTRRARSSDPGARRGSCGSPRTRVTEPASPSASTRRAKPVEVVGDDVLGVDMSLRPDPPRQPHRVIAAAGADIGHVEAGFYAQQRHDPLRLAGLVARLLVSPSVGDDPGNLPARRRKCAGGDAGWREPVLVTGRAGSGRRQDAQQKTIRPADVFDNPPLPKQPWRRISRDDLTRVSGITRRHKFPVFPAKAGTHSAMGTGLAGVTG